MTKHSRLHRETHFAENYSPWEEEENIESRFSLESDKRLEWYIEKMRAQYRLAWSLYTDEDLQ